MDVVVSFLDLEAIKYLHSRIMQRSGGFAGIRDYNALLSAIEMPKRTLEYSPDPDLRSMAAAYLFHLCQNHPFIDGNKRIGALSAIVFLASNKVYIDIPNSSFTEATFAVASGKMSKEAITCFFKQY